MVFKKPADVSGTAFLSWEYDDPAREDDKWLYMPALKKVRRISGASKNEYFMGSDFTYFFLDEIVKNLYQSDMDTKEDLIKDAIRELLRIARLCSRIEAMPIHVSEDLQVSTREAHTIQAIGERETINVTQVADHFGITKSAASQMAAKLEKRGLLVKKPAAHSNKEFELILTELGWQAFYAHERFHGKDFAQLVDSLSMYPISQIATLSVLMSKLGGVMEKRLSRHFND